jgi:hypothetical protein
MAFLVVLDSMTPAQRVTFLLHEIFRYPFTEVAQIVSRRNLECGWNCDLTRHRRGSAGARLVCLGVDVGCHDGPVGRS